MYVRIARRSSESTSCRITGTMPLILFCQRGFVVLVASEIFLNWIGELVFVRDIGFKNGIELRPFRREFREFKVAAFLEADKKNALAVLRHDALGVYHLRINPIAQMLLQRLHNDLK